MFKTYYYVRLISVDKPNLTSTFISFTLLHQWRSDSVLKTGKWEMTGFIPSRAFRSSRSEFSVVFSETRVKTG